jgi:hypothetical protein
MGREFGIHEMGNVYIKMLLEKPENDTWETLTQMGE